LAPLPFKGLTDKFKAGTLLLVNEVTDNPQNSAHNRALSCQNLPFTFQRGLSIKLDYSLSI